MIRRKTLARISLQAMSLPRLVFSGFGSLTAMMSAIGTVWMFGIMFLILADVFGRNILGTPIVGVPELVAYSLVGSVFLQLPNTLYSGRFVRAELFIDKLEIWAPIAAKVFNILFNFAGLMLFAVIVSQMWGQFLMEFSDPYRYATGNHGVFLIANWPASLIITLGAALTGIAYCLKLCQLFYSLGSLIKSQAYNGKAAPVGWISLLLLASILVGIWASFYFDLSRVEIGALSILGMLLFILAGIDIAIGLIGLSFLGIWLMLGTPDVSAKILKIASGQFLKNYFFGVVPLFVLMGLLLKETGIAADTFQVARWLLRNVKGGLGVATVLANAVFAAITGSSIASAAVFTKIATPELLKNGYTPRFSVGVVAGSSVLGMLIPPSLLMIIYGFVAQVSVGALFIAAIVPGVVLALAMSIMIIGMAHFWPSYVGTPKPEDAPVETLGSSLVKLGPIIILVTAVLGGIYTGLTTPVESGAIGAMGALMIAVAMRRLTWRMLWTALVETGHVTVAILFLILAANVFTRMLALSGLPQDLAGMVFSSGLGFFAFMLLYVGIVIFLGMFLESVSLILILVPVALPIIHSLGGDLVWFGIITVIAVEMGLLTPPMGIACYVVRSTADDPRITIGQVFAGAFPFTIIMLCVTLLLIAVPSITLYFL